MKGGNMEPAGQPGEESSVGEKKPRSKWDMFMNFLAYGGFLILVVVVVAILILGSILLKKLGY
jgi:hypothetical protein